MTYEASLRSGFTPKLANRYILRLIFCGRESVTRYNLTEMAALPIVIGENTPILRAKSVPVKKITKEIKQLIADMQDTVAAAKGAGLAAPQVGRSERLCIALLSKKMTPMINPIITWKSETTAIAEEGCLSLPDLWLNVSRSTEIIVAYETETGKKRELKLSGFDARVVQHETDHLDGILITDHRRQTVL